MSDAVTFRATVQRNGKSATGIEVPAEIVTGLGAGKRPKVRATVNGHTYRSSVGVLGGRYLLPVSAEIRAAAGVAAGDEVEVALAVDAEPRTVAVPDDLAAAFAARPAARRVFDAMSYSHQRRYVLAIDDARTPQTRERRIAKTVDELGQRATDG